MITLVMLVVLIRSNLLDIRRFAGGFLIHLLIQLAQRYRLQLSNSPDKPFNKRKIHKKN